MKWYALLIGYSFPLLVGVLLMKNVIERLWECLLPVGAQQARIRPETWQPRVLAFMESVLYMQFIQMGHPWFIVAWMAFKIAGQWQRWNGAGDEANGRPSGSVIFNVFLIGNGFVIFFAVVGCKLTAWIHHEQWLRALWAPIAAVLMTVAFYHWLGRFRKISPPAGAA